MNKSVSKDLPITILELAEHTSKVWTGTDSSDQEPLEIPIGVDMLISRCFQHQPPLPIELEYTVEITEEAVMPFVSHVVGRTRLKLQGPCGRMISQNLLGQSHQKELTLELDEIESIFNRLVSVSEGRPSSQETRTTEAHFFAAVLILREFMHHLQFNQLDIEM